MSHHPHRGRGHHGYHGNRPHNQPPQQGRGLLSFLEQMKHQSSTPPSQNPQPLPFPAPAWLTSAIQARQNNNMPPPPRHIPPIQAPPPVPQSQPPLPPVSSLVPNNERSKMSDQEYEDFMLMIALSLSTKEQEDKKEIEVIDVDKHVHVDGDISLKESVLDNKTLEGWLQYEDAKAEASHSLLQDPVQPSPVPVVQPQQVAQTMQTTTQTTQQGTLMVSENETLLSSITKTESSLQLPIPEKPDASNSEQVPAPSIVDKTQNSVEDVKTTEAMDDSSEEQSATDDNISTRGKKRKLENADERKGKKKTRTKLIKLMQEVKEKAERIRDLEDSIEESNKKAAEQNERLAKLETVLADYEKNNAELGSTWCSVM